jgi:hypothetical protein
VPCIKYLEIKYSQEVLMRKSLLRLHLVTWLLLANIRAAKYLQDLTQSTAPFYQRRRVVIYVIRGSQILHTETASPLPLLTRCLPHCPGGTIVGQQPNLTLFSVGQHFPIIPTSRPLIRHKMHHLKRFLPRASQALLAVHLSERSTRGLDVFMEFMAA